MIRARALSHFPRENSLLPTKSEKIRPRECKQKAEVSSPCCTKTLLSLNCVVFPPHHTTPPSSLLIWLKHSVYKQDHITDEVQFDSELLHVEDVERARVVDKRKVLRENFTKN